MSKTHMTSKIDDIDLYGCLKIGVSKEASWLQESMFHFSKFNIYRKIFLVAEATLQTLLCLYLPVPNSYKSVYWGQAGARQLYSGVHTQLYLFGLGEPWGFGWDSLYSPMGGMELFFLRNWEILKLLINQLTNTLFIPIWMLYLWR